MLGASGALCRVMLLMLLLFKFLDGQPKSQPPASALTVLALRDGHSGTEEDNRKGKSHELQNLIHSQTHRRLLFVKPRDILLQDSDRIGKFLLPLSCFFVTGHEGAVLDIHRPAPLFLRPSHRKQASSKRRAKSVRVVDPSVSLSHGCHVARSRGPWRTTSAKTADSSSA